MSPIQTIQLNDGVSIPWVAFGSGTALFNKDAVASIVQALDGGFNHLDGAQAYGNESSFGDAIVQASEKAGETPNDFRSKLHITTKLATLDAGETVKDSLQKSLKKLSGSTGKLDITYVDLFLIHMPRKHEGKLKEVWKGMEEVKAAGLAK